jgi:LysR family transcriptional regulator, cyn operon transcriptional activator
MPPVNLHQLRYLVATAEHGTMTRAAHACSVGQPALTRAIRGLETELGVVLFRRVGRRVELTDGGAEVVARAQRVLTECDAIEHYGRGASARAVLNVAATATIQRDLGSGLISDFWERYPQFPVRFVSCDDALAVGEAVASGMADVGVSDLPSMPGLVAVVYESREVVLIAPPESPLPDPLPIQRIADLALVCPTADTRRRAGLDSYFETLGIEPRVAFESDERGSWIPAVLSGLGCCIWYRAQAQVALDGGAQVVSLEPPMHVEIAVLHRPERLTPPIRGLVRLAADRAGSAGI